MSKRYFYRRILIVLVAIALFISGKFYKELDAFFIDPYSLVGLMFVVFAFLITAIVYLKFELSKKSGRVYHYSDRNQIQDELIYSLKNEIRLLKQTTPKKKK